MKNYFLIEFSNRVDDFSQRFYAEFLGKERLNEKDELELVISSQLKLVAKTILSPCRPAHDVTVVVFGESGRA